MLPAWSYEAILDELAWAFRYRYPAGVPQQPRMVGLLFARPEIPIAREEIVPSLEYFHHRSGNNIDFFCAGYRRYAPSQEPGEQRVTQSRTRDEEPPWLFSAFLFDRLRHQVERLSTWMYSGEADLLLMNALFNEDKARAWLDLESGIVCDLQRMKMDGAIGNVHRFLEDVFRFVEEARPTDPTWGFSDQMGIRAAGTALKRIVLSLLPKDLGKDYKRVEHFAVRSIARKQ